MRALTTLAALLFSVTAASAHSWYSERRDPIYSQTSCCGGQDCAPLPPHSMKITPEGLRVTLTAGEARAINPIRRHGFDRLIPFDRIQVSEDGMAHICLMVHDMEGDPREGFYCIFLPPNG